MWATIECWTCSARDPECTTCAGTGRVPVNRCATFYATPAATTVVRVAAMLRGGHGTPWSDAPGYMDWPAAFLDAIGLATRELNDIEAEERERARNGRD